MSGGPAGRVAELSRHGGKPMADGAATRPCPVCAATSAAILHEMGFGLAAGSPLPSQYRIVSCQSCGMVYADSAARQADYDRHYEQFSKYEDAKTASGGGHSPADRARLDGMAAVLAGHLAKTDSILDIGCANGGLLEALANRGFTRLTGVDPSPGSIRHILRRGFRGHALKISELSKETVGAQQAIVLSHVMEHVFDVAPAMKTLNSLLGAGGLLYIEVPNAAKYSSHPAVPYYYFDAEHINHFDSEALDNLAGLHGFEVIARGEKTIQVSSSNGYPAVYAIFKKPPGYTLFSVRFTSHLQLAIQHYIAQSGQDSRLEKIEGYAASGEAVILWGAGSYTQRLLAASRLADCNIVAIVDSDQNKQGLSLHSLPIQSPAVLREIEGAILIAAAICADEIKQDIMALGLRHKIEVLG